MREDALAYHAGNPREQYSRGNQTRASDGDGLGCGLGGILIDDGIVRGDDVGAIERAIWLMCSYDANSLRDRMSIATESVSL
jgi:hypothetical protein